MKRTLPTISVTLLVCFLSGIAFGQTVLVPDQNPNFAVSRDKYMKMADSLNEWHSTTFQDTYKAIDWLADRAEARADRREFRRQLRLERVQWNDYYNTYPYYPSYRGNWNIYPNYNNGYYNNRFYDYRRYDRNNRGRWSVGLNYFWP